MQKTLSESRKLRPLLITGFLFMLFCCGPLWALAEDPNLDQDVVVTGKITSTEDNSAVPGVNVILKGTSQGTVSDADGRYSISVPSAESVLVFSAIGFATQEVSVGTRANIDVVLTLDVQTLSEVIVVGYGTQEKRDVTAS
ncbi:MAG TPA: carboxypeptidase-like regulatory domain-containing protein, partial [Cyclobacteriaceae bacterium]|nr:carboxypeptidase-like regulatory domain-containing protein [Cyclobacteriaceae bacterium]